MSNNYCYFIIGNMFLKFMSQSKDLFWFGRYLTWNKVLYKAEMEEKLSNWFFLHHLLSLSGDQVDFIYQSLISILI